MQLHHKRFGHVQKLYAPPGILGALNRYYFLFGKPIHTSPDMSKDRDAAARVYKQAQCGLEDCITYLLEQREHDVYANPLRRLLYERMNRRQAPTFVPPPNKRI